jgi:ATP-dependent helicase IRC3
MVAALSTGVVSTPTLFGLDPAEIIENADTKSLTSLKERKGLEKEREKEARTTKQLPFSKRLPGSITFTDYDSVHDLIADTSGDQYIRDLSPHAWVGIGDGKFVLSTNSGNYLIIEPTQKGDGHFKARYYWRLPADKKVKSPYGTPRIVAEGDSFEHIVHAADTFALEAFEHMWISKHQPWRRSLASQSQVNFLNKFRSKEDQLKPEDLTKGKAGDMITRMKHGIKGRYEKAALKQQSEWRMKERAQTIQKRLQGQVQVGPLQQLVQSTRDKMTG